MSKRINNKYTKEFKLKAIRMYLDENLSYSQIASKLNIKSKTQVINWVKQFEINGEAYFDFETRGAPWKENIDSLALHVIKLVYCAGFSNRGSSVRRRSHGLVLGVTHFGHVLTVEQHGHSLNYYLYFYVLKHLY